MNSLNIKIQSTNKNIIKASLALVSIAVLSWSSVAQARPNTSSCPAGNTISKTFSSGAAWDMCWEVRDEEGVVLSDVHYKPRNKTRRRVLGEASLSQIQTEYDDGSATEFLVTQFGLGGSNLQTLTSSMCEGGQLRSNAGRDVLCEVTKANGYIYRYRNSTRRQGSKLDLFSASNINAREFIIKWSFLENGTIEVASGLTGQFNKTTSNAANGWQVTAQNRIATGFTDHYFWRMDFDIANDNGNDIIEQIKSVPSSDRLTKTKQVQTISSELAASFTPADKKFWRVKDQSVTNAANQAISYEMVMLNYAQQSKGNSNSAWLKNDVFMTEYKACERFAVQNPTNNCASNVSQFVNGDNINAKDVVAWYRLVHHTLPRDEDFSPAAVQWSHFILLPRDWTSTNSL
jgi:primary-amine oxidase